MFDTEKDINRYGEIYADLLEKEGMESTVRIARALSHPARIQILQQLRRIPRSITELARLNRMTNSTVIFHLKALEEAGLVFSRMQPNKKGKTLIFYINFSKILLSAQEETQVSHELVLEQSIGVGSYLSAAPSGYIRIATQDRFVVLEKDDVYHPRRFDAKLLCLDNGEVCYAFSNAFARRHTVKRLEFSLEISSESPYYCNDWKSEIVFSVCGVDLATYLSPGDFGGTRGRLTPAWWESNYSQYGMLVTVAIDAEGVYLNDECVRTDVTLETLPLAEEDRITFSLRTDPSLRYCGGFNIYGSRFGNEPQDIVMRATVLGKEDH